MISNRLKYLVLTFCILLSVWLLAAQIMGNSWILMPCLLGVIVLTVWSAVRGMALPVLLYFLPFAPLLKMRQGAISFFTIALLCAYLLYAVKGFRGFNIYHFIPGLLIISVIMIAKAIYGYSFENNYILFSASLLLVPYMIKEIDENYGFYCTTVFFVIGIAFAAISARYLVLFPNISQFISTEDIYGVSAVRYSGYYGDPNFYSAHITAALSGVLIQLLGSGSKKRVFMLILLAGILLYCGLLSVSKSFFLIAICMLLFWVFALLFSRGKISVKVTLIFGVIVSSIFLLSSTFFTDLVDALLARFARDQNLSDLTTRRTDIWLRYLDAFEESPLLLWLGRGFNNILIRGRAAHNTLIQCVYQLGLLGSLCLGAWIVCFIRNLLKMITVKWADFLPILILLVGSVGPWMALDLVFFDEFFLIPLYICVGVCYITRERSAKEIEINEEMSNM